jgi:hypothetical protein
MISSTCLGEFSDTSNRIKEKMKLFETFISHEVSNATRILSRKSKKSQSSQNLLQDIRLDFEKSSNSSTRNLINALISKARDQTE